MKSSPFMPHTTPSTNSLNSRLELSNSHLEFRSAFLLRPTVDNFTSSTEVLSLRKVFGVEWEKYSSNRLSPLHLSSTAQVDVLAVGRTRPELLRMAALRLEVICWFLVEW